MMYLFSLRGSRLSNRLSSVILLCLQWVLFEQPTSIAAYHYANEQQPPFPEAGYRYADESPYGGQSSHPVSPELASVMNEFTNLYDLGLSDSPDGSPSASPNRPPLQTRVPLPYPSVHGTQPPPPDNRGLPKADDSTTPPRGVGGKSASHAETKHKQTPYSLKMGGYVGGEYGEPPYRPYTVYEPQSEYGYDYQQRPTHHKKPYKDESVHYSRLGYYDHGPGAVPGHPPATQPLPTVPFEDIIVSPVNALPEQMSVLPGLCSRINLPSPESDFVRRDITGDSDLSYRYDPIERARVTNDGISLTLAAIDSRGNEDTFGEISTNTDTFDAHEISFTTPAHHLIDTTRFPLEMFIEHRNTDSEGVQIRNTLGVLFKIGLSNPFLANLTRFADFPVQIGTQTTGDTFLDLNDVLGTGGLVYEYNGDDTVLPCDANNQWGVLFPPVEASHRELQFLEDVLIKSTFANATNLASAATLGLALRDEPLSFKSLKIDELQNKIERKWEKDVDNLNELFVNPASVFNAKRDMKEMYKEMFGLPVVSSINPNNLLRLGG